MKKNRARHFRHVFFSTRHPCFPYEELPRPVSFFHLVTARSSPKMPTAYDQVTSANTQQRPSSSENTLNDHEKDTGLNKNINGSGSAIGENQKFDEEDDVRDYQEKTDGDDLAESDPEGEHIPNRRDEENPHFIGQMKPVGFWDPALSKTRKWVLINWVRTILILIIAIMTILGMYWAVLFRVEQNLEALKIAVVSFDGQFAPYAGTTPLVGQAVIQATEMAGRQPGHLGFFTRDPAVYNSDPLALRVAVFEEHIWAAIIVNNNATALLQDAVRTGNANYDPLGACQIIYNQARDQDTYGNYIIPVLNQLQVQIQATFGEQWITHVLANTNLNAATYANSPQALNPAIGFSIYNLRPFSPPTATPAVSIGLIYLIIIAFFSFSFFLPIHSKYITPEGHPPMHFYQLIIWRWLATVVAYLFMSLAYSLVSLAFLIPFSHTGSWTRTEVVMNADLMGHGTFPVYWMLNFIGMIALGLACENVAMMIGQPWTALWLIFWVITNVSTSFYAIPLSPGFFKWGYAWPLHQVVNASRTLLFGTKNTLGLNFGILLAWCAINTVLFPVCCVFMRWGAAKEEAKKAGKPKARIMTLLR